MKKVIWIILLLLVVSPAWALFCQNCGKTMPEDAKFCPQCGKGRVVIQQEERIMVTYPPVVTPPAQAPILNSGIPDSFFAAYEPIDRFGMFLATANHSRAGSKAAEFRLEIARGLREGDILATQYSPAMTKIHFLYEKKKDLLNRFLEAMNGCENGAAKVQAQAQKEKLQFMLSKTDEMIRLLKENRYGTSDSCLTKVADMEKELDESTREYPVVTPFLQVDSHRVSRGQPIWVIEVKDGMAKVMHMGQGSWSSPVTGWVSVGNLEYRTGWRQKYREGMFSPVIHYEPVYRPREVIIVHDESWDWDWDWHSRSRHRRHRGNWPCH